MRIVRIVHSLWLSAFIFLSISLFSCKKEVKKADELSALVIDKISSLGFSTENLQKTDQGYLTEGDIVLSDSDLDGKPETRFVRIAGNEQYRTFNLITALPKTITISLSNQFPFIYGTALDEAIQRYNTENLQIHFQRANNNGDIEIVKTHENFVGASGLPSPNGKVYRIIQLNPVLIGNGSRSSFISYIATLIAHEIGHCIGFRHTDYLNRSFSCKGRSVNEGAGNSGAVNIPGTPSGSDSGSWMLACIAVNQSRPFNDNDKIALRYLY